jgi:hypothetical protein
MRRASIGLALVALFVGTGCFDNVTTEFPPGLEPWEDPNMAPPPDPVGADTTPEALSMVRSRWVGGAASVHARAYVHADVATTFAAVRHPLAGADRRESTTFTYEEGTDPSVPYSHSSHLTVPDIVTVEFELDWRSDVVEGTLEEPVITATRWQKVWGTSAISLLEGSIVCRYVSEGVTEIEIQYHLDSIGGGYETVEKYLTDYYASILALAHDQPLPIQE